MASDSQQASPVESILERFKNGARLTEEGHIFSDIDIYGQGIDLIKASLKELDALGPNSREALIPLLDDSSPAFRCWAAVALVRLLPERSLAMLHQLRDRSIWDARMIASHMLIHHDLGRLKFLF